MVKTASKQIRKKEKQTPLQLGRWKRGFAVIQRIGKSLLFPIAMLPFAAICLRIGAEIPTDTPFAKFINTLFTTVGNSVFGTALPFMFALGIGFGMTKDQRGEAAITTLAAMILITTFMSSSLPQDVSKVSFGNADLVDQIYGKLNLGGDLSYGHGFHAIFGSNYTSILAHNVLTGIFAGSIVSYVYNRFSKIELPSILGFFSGRRLVPVLGFMFCTVGGILWAIIFPWVGYGIYYLSTALGSATGNRWSNAGIMFVYGIINRLLIPFGLHHIPNTIFWFTLPISTPDGSPLLDLAGKPVSGDIFGFLHGVAKGNTSGTFQSGFFPIMMFGLPAMAFAIWFNAKDDIQKKRVAALFAGSSIVSFFTGITEPIEFTFVFVAPLLYGFHAILTGLFGFIVGIFGIQLGFGFSAGLIDYVLSIPKSLAIIEANKTGFDAFISNPFWLWAIGAGAAATYFFGANFLIRKFNLNTPGRGNNLLIEKNIDLKDLQKNNDLSTNTYTKDALIFIKAVGGKKNIKSLSNCATRLRFQLRDNTIVDKKIIGQTVAKGQIKVAGGYQIIVGPTVEMYADEIQRQLQNS